MNFLLEKTDDEELCVVKFLTRFLRDCLCDFASSCEHLIITLTCAFQLSYKRYKLPHATWFKKDSLQQT